MNRRTAVIDANAQVGLHHPVWRGQAIHMNIMKFLTLALICPAVVIIALFGGLWWLLGIGWGKGAVFVIGLWAFAFNRLPTRGLECLKDKFNMQFILPLAVLSSIGFAVGFFIKN